MTTMLPRHICAAMILGTMSSVGGLAAAQHAHGAHVHGEAQAAMAIDGGRVSVSLNSAMYNITGFERAPQNAEEEAALADAIAAIKAGEALFVLSPSADCTLDSVTHSLPEAGPPEDSDHNPYRDLEASYEFSCTAPAELQTATIMLFEKFGNLEHLDMVVFNGDAQIAIRLSADQNRIDLTG